MAEGWGTARIRRLAYHFGLALAPACLLGAYAWFPSLTFLPYVALTPWIVLYTDDRDQRAPLITYLLAVWIVAMLEYPQTFRTAWFAGPIFALFMCPIGFLFVPLLRRIHQRLHLPRTLTVPLVWVAVEWLTAKLTVGHFAFYRLGYSQARVPLLIQIADLTGVYGVSFAIAAVNGLLADAYFALRDAGWSPNALRKRRLAVAAGSVLLGFVLVAAYGALRLATAVEHEGPRVALVQPCTSHKPGNAIGDHLAEVLITERQVPSGAAELMVWPENAVLDNIRRDGMYLDDLGWLARTKSALVLVGGMGWSQDRPGKKFNGAFLVNPEGKIVGEYDKQVLFPFTEYLPFDEDLSGLSPALQKFFRHLVRISWGSVAQAIPGDGTVLFHIPWNGGDLPFAVLICSENTYPPVPAEAGRLGARFFVNITSEGNMGGEVQEQLMRISVLRAVENRVAYVRVGNTGISGVVDAMGRLRSVLRGEHGAIIMEPGVLIDRVPLSPGGATVYARSHDAFAKACVAITVALFLVTFSSWKRRSPVAALIGVALLAAQGCSSPPPLGRDAGASPAALERGRRFHRRGEFAAALLEMARACGEPESCRAALTYAEDCFIRTKDLENGEEFFAQIASRYPALAAEAGTSRGVLLERAGDIVAAEKEYGASLAVAPTARACVLLTELLLRRVDLEDAVKTAREGARLAPDDPETASLLARSLRRSGNLEESQRVLDEYLARLPNAAGPWIELARLRFARGDDRGAEEALRSAVLADPSSIEGRFLLARTAVRSGRIDDAQQRLREIEGLQDGSAKR